MSYIDSINQAVTAQTQSQKTDTDKSRDIMGKEDFLTLLVTQLKNQDPLNPDEPTEFTAQLAQFSSLEQLFNLNESMDNVAASVGDSQKLSALSMIGKEVAYADATFRYDGSPVQLGYSIDDEAKSITLQLQHNGTTVATLEGEELSKGNHYLSWDGLTEDGTPAPTGEYTIVIQASAASESIAAAPLVRSEVTGIDLDADRGGRLFTKSGEVYLNDIKGVYEIGSAAPKEETAAEEYGSGQEEPLEETVGDIAADTESTGS